MIPLITPTWLAHKNGWSRQTFGPGPRLKGVLDHIRKELVEIEEHPNDPEEWADLILLAFDGAARQGIGEEEIIETLRDKQERNTKRTWPDWHTADPDKAIEHIETEIEQAETAAHFAEAYGYDDNAAHWRAKAQEARAAADVKPIGEPGEGVEHYCRNCGTHEDNHAPGGSRYRHCTFQPLCGV